MATIGRGRGRGSVGSVVPGSGGPNPRDNGTPRGSWRGGPPGSAANQPANTISRGGTPVVNNPATGPRTSIVDHMTDLRKVQDGEKGPGKSFQTDGDISANPSRGGPRELQPWVADGPENPVSNGASRHSNGNGGSRDTETFGTGGSNGQWDQFATNERLFGATTNYQEELYTTKLNRTGADYKKREKEADKLANEIMGTTSSNPHIQEERNQLIEDWSKDEEERFSGVTRAPNAYVPPGARRNQGAAATIPSRPAPPVATATASSVPKTNGGVTTTAPPPAVVNPALERSNSDVAPSPAAPSTAVDSTPAKVVPATSTPTPPAAVPASEPKEKIGGVVDKFREFVGSEREKVEAKKQAVVKSERDRHMAELKKFHSNFKVPLPIPKDILPILSKDSEKQKAIAAKAADEVEAARQQAEQRKAALLKSPPPAASPASSLAKIAASPVGGTRKIVMKIPEIPPFGGGKPKAPVLPVPETASQNIALSTSPTPSSTSQASAAQPKLNPGASAFVFKPNPGAAVFKPAESNVSSPSPAAPKLPPTTPSQPAASTSAIPVNPFFGSQTPQSAQVRAVIQVRDDFNPWKNGSVASASSISPQWPYTGRKYAAGFSGVAGIHVPPPIVPVFDEESRSAHGVPPPMMQGMPPPPYGYRFNPGMPQQPMQSPMQGNPMFSPGPHYATPLPGVPMGQQQSHQHIPHGPGQPNGMPMYFPNGMPQNPHFIQHQQLAFNPNSPQRQSIGGPQQLNGPVPGQGPQQPQGPGQGGPNGGPGPGPQMFYHPQGQIPTPQQTPQMQHNVPFPGQPQFQGMQMQQGLSGGL